MRARSTSVKNGVAALRQEAFRADNHFSNASNKMFEAIIPHLHFDRKAVFLLPTFSY
jgi:hypothetical protein